MSTTENTWAHTPGRYPTRGTDADRAQTGTDHLAALIAAATERGELPCPHGTNQCTTVDGHWYHGDCERTAELAKLPYCVTVTKPEQEPVHLGFHRAAQAESAQHTLVFNLYNTAHPAGTRIVWGLTPEGATPIPPIPAYAESVLEAMDADGDGDPELRYPTAYDRLRAQLGSEEASKLWTDACRLADDQAEAEEAQRQQEAQRTTQAAVLNLLRAVRATHWHHSEPRPRHQAGQCKKCDALREVDVDTMIKWVEGATITEAGA